jgi:hypothetical protein
MILIKLKYNFIYRVTGNGFDALSTSILGELNTVFVLS